MSRVMTVAPCCIFLAACSVAPRTVDSRLAVLGFDGMVIYSGNANDDAPHLVVGYQHGYRASWQTSLGGASGDLVEVNARKCSGERCILPDAVPGILFNSFHPERPLRKLPDIATHVQQEGTSPW